MINFNPIRSSIEFQPGVCHPHVRISRISALSYILSLSLSPTKVTTILSNGAISISRCTKHEQRSHIHVVRSRKRTESPIRLPGLKGDRFPGGCDRDDVRFGLPSPPGKSHAWSKGLTIPELDFNTLYFMSFFFSIYILI